jgi:hypothetical protein
MTVVRRQAAVSPLQFSDIHFVLLLVAGLAVPMSHGVTLPVLPELVPRVDADGGMPPGHEFDKKSIHLDGNQARLAAAVTHVPACTGRIICKATDPLRDAAAGVPA